MVMRRPLSHAHVRTQVRGDRRLPLCKKRRNHLRCEANTGRMAWQGPAGGKDTIPTSPIVCMPCNL